MEERVYKPLIGVMPLWDEKKNSIWMLPGYMDGIEAGGGTPVILPLKIGQEDLLNLLPVFDGFLFTGGHDVSPFMYGEPPIEECGPRCRERDLLEKNVFKYAWDNDIPILGICRGVQVINVFRGGTLYQDLERQWGYGGDIHHMDPPYTRDQHKVILEEGTPLYDLWGVKVHGVNSYHHQAVKDLGKDLVIMARAEDGLIESVYAPGKTFVWGVQWHPEFSYISDPKERAIFARFAEACSKKHTAKDAG